MMPNMNATSPCFDEDTCYLALKARDARFDGNFFTGVTSTGIYCRPVCRVRTPKRENCRFFAHAAQAEQAGFRPCLRCRPELAPQRHVAHPSGTPRAWSMQDASAILAHQAALRMDHHHASSVADLARHMGISERHLRRIVETAFGVSPSQYLQTRRLLCAKQLLTDTALPVEQVAHMSGYANVRRFNAVLLAHYGFTPTALRRSRPPGSGSRAVVIGVTAHLAYRPPYDVQAILGFFATRQLGGTEVVQREGPCPSIGKTLALTHAGHTYRGWLVARFMPARQQVALTVSDGLAAVLPQVMARVRHWLDLDADPHAIHAVLAASFPDAEGQRLPGTLDGFELAVRAILGQQITVRAACTLCERVVDRFGEPLTTSVAGLHRLFPTPARLACAEGDELGQLGIVRQRQNAIMALASAVHQGALQLHPGADPVHTHAALMALPGIGDWTAQYICMRALAWPDAFPAGDVALHKAMGLQNAQQPARAAVVAAQAWQPWRSYAVVRAWASLVPLPDHLCLDAKP